MIIKGQDKDLFLEFTGGAIYWDEKRDENTKLLGYNFYGEIDHRVFLLGTYDIEEECQEVTEMIDKAIKIDTRLFEMPDFPVGDEDD